MFAKSNAETLACFAVMGSIASTTRKFGNDVRAQAIEHFIFELEKIGMRVEDLKITLISQKERFLIILFFKSVLISSDNLPRNGKTITKSFFSAVNVTGFSVSLLLRMFLMQLSINLIGNAFFFNISFKWHTSNEILKNPKELKTFEIMKWKSNQLYIRRKWNCWNLNILH